VIENLRQQLARQIEDIFSNIPYPGDNEIGREEVKEFRGHWKTIPLNIIKSRRSDLGFFSIKGFRYYLPSLMIAVLLYPDRVDTLLDSIIRVLAPPLDNSYMQGFVRKVEVFSNEEKATIYSFLESYKVLFPDGNWAFFEQSRQTLERAIGFWKQYKK
jgi:hypothetical protein